MVGMCILTRICKSDRFGKFEEKYCTCFKKKDDPIEVVVDEETKKEEEQE